MRMDGRKTPVGPQKPPYMRMDGRKLMGLYWEEGPSDTKDTKDTNERGILQDAWEGTKKRESDKFVECRNSRKSRKSRKSSKSSKSRKSRKSRNLSNSREVLSMQLTKYETINK